jgi:hypothetical protein
MIAKKCSWLAAGALAAACLVSFQTAQAGTVTHVQTFLDSTDYSDAGLDLGNLGYVFFNWGQSTSTTGDLPQANWNEALPSWITLDLDQTSANAAFGGQVTSSGGQAAWNDLTDPIGNTARSGSIVDPESNNNSNNSIRQFEFAAGVPASFLVSLVVDNTNGEHDPDSKLRPRLDQGGDTNVEIGVAGFNGEADVYQFKIEGHGGVGDFLKVQLRTTTSTDGGIAGIMFDVIPEPTSAMLLMIGGMGLTLAGRRRR